MRWDALFSDLAGQIEAADAEQWRAEAQARERSERASIGLADRLAAAHGRTLSVTLSTGDVVVGVLRDGADDWILIADDHRREHVVPLQAVAGMGGLPPAADLGAGLARRLTFAHALRVIARDRSRVAVATAGWRGLGLVHRVGRDHVEVGEPGQPPITVPLAAIVCVSSAAV